MSKSKSKPNFASFEAIIPLDSQRVVTGFGFNSGSPLIGVELTISGTPNPVTGFVDEFGELNALYNITIGNELNNKALIEKGEPIPPGLSKPILKLNFSPSAENIALFVFKKLDSVLAQNNLRLDRVTAIIPQGKGIVEREMFK
ncbi:6-pyruvoyl trahydropterin synthase family protein [Bacillus sp. 2205SS5-2]|uniref:6-pyruvoyl trahydropterin synthase family protein n=1 Tax=Bacillus sp. 2205SS5-2 TaxID=3109031 RepID=UPI003003DC3B